MASPPASDLATHATIVVKAPADLRARLGGETLVVTGSPRGATSLVAYALRRGGYPLAARATSLNHEDDAIVAARDDPAALLAVVEARNAEGARWGFKLPFASRAIDWYARHLRRPVFVMVYRNPLAIARSIARREPQWPDTSEGLDRALRRGLEMMTAGTDVLRQDAPAVLIDADAAKATPEVFVAELFAALVIDAPPDRVAEIARELTAPGYKRV